MKIINKMYGGSVELVFDTMKHQYSVGGEVVLGTTSVLQVIAKPALLYWSANMASDYFKENIKAGVSYDEIQIENIWKEAKRAHTKKKESAGDLGHLVHDWVDKYCKGESPSMPINEQAQGSINRFLKWVEENQVKFLINEQPCYSQKYKYAGTIDGICKIGGKMYLFDLKTSNSIHSEYYLQTSAYLNARTEEFPEEKFDGVLILRVGKEEGELDFVTKPMSEYPTYLKAFLYSLYLKKSLDEVDKLIEK